jgi:hypothetical protein
MRAGIPLAATAAALLSFAGIQNSLAAGAPALDNGLFATFSASPTSVSFSVCGQTGGSSGCFGGASLSPPFEQACAVLQGKPRTKGDVMTRDIYVLDKRTSSSAPIMLYVYERSDTIANGFDSVSATLKKTVNLGLTGGTASHCALAGNLDYVYAATSADTVVAGMDKATYAVSDLGGFSPPATVTSITADDRGYVSLHFTEGFYVYDPNGNLQEDGGGAADFINQRNGWATN